MLLSLMLFSAPLFAQTADDCDDPTTKQLKPVMEVAAAAAESTACPNPNKLENICMNISNRTKDPNPKGDYSYMYQRKIYDAACVNLSKDSDEIASQKIQEMWARASDQLKCESLQFDVPAGNVLKFAVSKKFNEFLEDAIYWKVDLNRIDHSDQRTVLDYIQYQIDKNKGTTVEVTLKHYYKILKEAGAKHKAEL